MDPASPKGSAKPPVPKGVSPSSPVNLHQGAAGGRRQLPRNEPLSPVLEKLRIVANSASVHLVPGVSPSPAELPVQLRKLPGLASLTVELHGARAWGTLDLGACPALRAIRLQVVDADDSRPCEFQAHLIVPDGAKVEVRGLPRPSIHASTVQYVDKQAAPVGGPVAVYGAMSYREPADGGPSDSKGNRRSAAHLQNLNHLAMFPALPPAAARPVKCRDLAVHRLGLQSDAAKPVDGKAPGEVSLAHLRAADSIAASLDRARIESDMDALLDQAGFRSDAAALGKDIAQCFRRMASDGATVTMGAAWYADHSLAIIMESSSVRHGSRERPQFTATIYEAFVTGADCVVTEGSPEAFESLTLESLLGKTLAAAACTGRGQSGQLDTSCIWYPWPPVRRDDVMEAAILGLRRSPLAGHQVDLGDAALAGECRRQNLACFCEVSATTALCLADGPIAHEGLEGVQRVGLGDRALAHLGTSFLEKVASARRPRAYLIETALLRLAPPANADAKASKRKRDDLS